MQFKYGHFKTKYLGFVLWYFILYLSALILFVVLLSDQSRGHDLLCVCCKFSSVRLKLDIFICLTVLSLCFLSILC